jgi:hypothetical protein
MIRGRQVDYIITPTAERLMRKLVDLEEMIDLVEAHSVTIIALAGQLDLSTPNGRLLARILVSVARNEIEVKVARQRSKNAQLVADGLPTKGGPRTPGYEAGLMTIREAEAQHIRWGFSAIVNGQPLRTVWREWNEKGFTNRSGNKWTVANVRKLLMNPRYAALSVIHSTSGNRSGMVPGQWPAIVTPDVWHATQAILNDPARRMTPKGKGGTRLYLLSGLARCFCGALVMAGRNNHNARSYRCSERPGHMARVAEPIDAYVLATVAQRLREKDAGGAITPAGQAVDHGALRDERAALRVRLDELVDLRADGDISKEQLQRGTARITVRLEAIRVELERDALLAPLLGQVDPGKAFLELTDLDQRRAVIARLAPSIILRSPGRGARKFDPASVEVLR